MPVRRLVIGIESPEDVRPTDSLQNMRVLRYVVRIIKIDESILKRRCIQSGNPRCKEDGEDYGKDAIRPRSLFSVMGISE